MFYGFGVNLRQNVTEGGQLWHATFFPQDCWIHLIKEWTVGSNCGPNGCDTVLPGFAFIRTRPLFAGVFA